MSDRLRAVGQTVCDRRGYDVTVPERPWLPAAVADPTADADPFVPRATSGPVAVEPLASEEVTPTMLLSRLRNNRSHGRFSLFVVDSDVAAPAREVLADPPLVAAEDDLGRRTFYTGPDRIPLDGGGYAAVRTETAPAGLVWREVGDGDGRSLALVDGGDVDDDVPRQPGADAVLAWLDGVDSLGCPPAGEFPYSYRRDPADKCFRIRTREGRVVGVYDGVSALRANAYVPVPMPLVPEHVFAGIDSVRDEWAILTVGSDGDAGDTDGASRVDVGDTHDFVVGLLTADGPASVKLDAR
jgi:hypothetical protein